MNDTERLNEIEAIAKLFLEPSNLNLSEAFDRAAACFPKPDPDEKLIDKWHELGDWYHATGGITSFDDNCYKRAIKLELLATEKVLNEARCEVLNYLQAWKNTTPITDENLRAFLEELQFKYQSPNTEKD